MDLAKLKAITDADVAGKRVVVRADLNVPSKNGQVTDATRLDRLVPGLKGLADRGARVIILSHFGRPKGTRDLSFSLKPIAAALGASVGRDVRFAEDCVGSVANDAVAGLSDGDILVLENTRFHAGEEANDPELGQAFAGLGDLFVNDAFSAAHRGHASTEGIARHLPAYAGPLLMEEISALRSALEEPRRPVAAVVGGAKVSTKIPVLKNLSSKVDKLIVGGGMANTFLMAQGVAVGKSLAEPEFADTVKEITRAAAEQGCEIVLPTDAVIASEFAAGAASEVVPVSGVPSEGMILDVGPESVGRYLEVLSGCETLLWNGPLGAFEIAPFGEGTFALARLAAAATQAGKLVSVAGGGDTVSALNAAGVTEKFTYVSSAGGAFLEWLEGRELPGIVALTR